MKVADVERVHVLARKALVDALPHPAGRAVREGEAEHVGEVHARLERVSDAFRENGGLAAARRRKDQMAAAGELDRRLLVRIEDGLGIACGGSSPRGGERTKGRVVELPVLERHEPDRNAVAVLEAFGGILRRAHEIVVIGVFHKGGRLAETEVRGCVADFANAAEVFVRHAVGELLHERRAHHLRVGKRVVLEDRAKHALGKLAHDLRAFTIVAVAKEAFGPLAEIGKRRIVKLKRRKVHERSRMSAVPWRHGSRNGSTILRPIPKVIAPRLSAEAR